MISNNESTCPKCGGDLKYYDSVKRIVRTKYGRKTQVNIRRFRCKKCGSMHQPNKAKHPYHLIAISGGGSNVYGWVDKGSFTKA